MGLLIVIGCIILAVGWLIDFVKANQTAVITLLSIAGGLIVLLLIAKQSARARERKAEAEEIQQQADLLMRQKELRREGLLHRYGDQIVVQAIIDRQIWHDMTKEQLLDSWGHPDDVKTETLRKKIKEEFKYDCVGVNRFLRRVYLENDVVVGWKQ